MQCNTLMAGLLAAGLALAHPVLSADKAPAAASVVDAGLLKNDRDIMSYGLGVQTGKSLKLMSGDIDLDLVIRGLRDEMKGAKLMISDKEMKRVLRTAATEMRRTQAALRQKDGVENREKGAAFFAENGKKPGVVTTASGLQYKILKAGTGAKPGLADTVLVKYRGTRLDGHEFDASPDEGPARLNATQLIAGWKEVLQLMPAGSHWQVWIPSELAYGARGAGTDIAPNETLVFDMELVGVEQPKSSAAPALPATPKADAKAK